MSILDQIANPGNPILEGIQVGQNIRMRQQQMQNERIRTGIALQNLQMKQQELERQKEGRAIIGKYLKPPTTKTNGQELQRPTFKTSEMDISNTAMGGGDTKQSQSPQILASLQQVPVDDFAKVNKLEDLRDELLGKGFLDLGNSVNTLFKEEYDRIKELKTEDRKTADKFFAQVGNNYYAIAKLEEQAAQEPDPNKKQILYGMAKQQYDQTWNNVMKDPQFKDWEGVQKLYQNFKDYTPGAGKYLYTGTMTASKVRDQFQNEQRLAETERAAKAGEKLATLKAETAKLKEGKPESFKSSDANAIYRFAVGFHGGLVDKDGNITTLDPNKRQDVQDLAELAAIYYSRGKVATHNEAISMAAKQLEMKEAAKSKKITPEEQGVWDRIKSLLGLSEEEMTVEAAAKKNNMTLEEMNASIELTAKNNNMTVEEVKKQLGIK